MGFDDPQLAKNSIILDNSGTNSAVNHPLLEIGSILPLIPNEVYGAYVNPELDIFSSISFFPVV